MKRLTILTFFTFIFCLLIIRQVNAIEVTGILPAPTSAIIITAYPSTSTSPGISVYPTSGATPIMVTIAPSTPTPSLVPITPIPVTLPPAQIEHGKLEIYFSLEGVSGHFKGKLPVAIYLSPTNGIGATTRVKANYVKHSQFKVKVKDIPVGIYDIFIKTDRHLARKFSQIEIKHGPNVVRAGSPLLAGDLGMSIGTLGDDFVSILDFSILASHLNTTDHSTADLNYDGKIDDSDFLLLSGNFSKWGDCFYSSCF